LTLKSKRSFFLLSRDSDLEDNPDFQIKRGFTGILKEDLKGQAELV
jgi:hypothetical protein